LIEKVLQRMNSNTTDADDIDSRSIETQGTEALSRIQSNVTDNDSIRGKKKASAVREKFWQPTKTALRGLVSTGAARKGHISQEMPFSAVCEGSRGPKQSMPTILPKKSGNAIGFEVESRKNSISP
jgi:hypothetical protein